MKLRELNLLYSEPRAWREGRPPDVHAFVAAVRGRTDSLPASPDETVEMPADAVKLLVDIADGKTKALPNRPPEDELTKLTRRMPYILAADYVRRLKHVWRERYGLKKSINEPAPKKAAERFGLDADKLNNFCRRSNRRK